MRLQDATIDDRWRCGHLARRPWVRLESSCRIRKIYVLNTQRTVGPVTKFNN